MEMTNSKLKVNSLLIQYIPQKKKTVLMKLNLSHRSLSPFPVLENSLLLKWLIPELVVFSFIDGA